jgi:hypothetical protein
MDKYCDTTEKLAWCAEIWPMQISILHNIHEEDKLNDQYDVTI